MATSIIDAPESVKLDRANIVGVRPAYDGKQIVCNGNITNANYVLYTVPADHILLLTFASVSINYAASLANYGYMVFNVTPTAPNAYFAISRTGLAKTSYLLTSTFVPPIQFEAGGQIIIDSQVANISVDGMIAGILMEV